MTDGSPSSRRSSGRSSRGRPTQAAAWPLLLLAAAAAVAPARPAAAAKGAEEAGAAAAGNRYDPWRYNQACKYSAQGIPASLFTNGLDNGVDFLFPLETSKAVRMYERPWEACFGPLETYSMAAIAAGMKLPCRYQVEKDGSYSYEEEHACDVLIKSNCYCYALDRFVGSYCEPGLGGTGKSFQLPVDDCEKPRAGVIADGGKLVDRATVYSGARPRRGHYIALAVKPAEDADSTGDFHFWRLDSNGGWSYKAGDTLVRNTLRNGTKIRDIEKDAAARGIYTSFCGYFHVIPQEHKLTGNQFWYSDVPGRYAQWQQRGVKATVQSLATLPTAWLTAYNDYFAENGWEDAPAPGTAKERAFAPAAGRGAAAAAADDGGRRAPHWYSVRPPLVLAA